MKSFQANVQLKLNTQIWLEAEKSLEIQSQNLKNKRKRIRVLLMPLADQINPAEVNNNNNKNFPIKIKEIRQYEIHTKI